MPITKLNRYRRSLTTVAALAVSSLATLPVAAQQAADVTARIKDTTANIQKHLDLLRSPSQVTRVVAFTEMMKSGNPALVSLTIEFGCALQADRTLAGIVSAPYKKGSLPAEISIVPNAVTLLAPAGS